MASSFTLLERWERFVPGQADAFLRELQVERWPGHALHGLELIPVAHSAGADDALFQPADGRVAGVHLTWSGKAEQSPAPKYRIYSSIEEWVEQAMIPAHEDH